jgi:hypothetical protein
MNKEELVAYIFANVKTLNSKQLVKVIARIDNMLAANAVMLARTVRFS